MVEYSIDDALLKDLAKMKKRDLTTYRIIMKQIDKVLETPEVGKPLRSSLFGLRRLHIGRSFVISYTYDKNSNKVRFIECDDWESFYTKHAE
jgi:addiction module RelE/StbE family toxin